MNQLASPAQVRVAVLNAATLDRVGNPGTGSPNRLLYTLALEGAQLVAPTATPVPPTATPTATAIPPTATPLPTATATPTATAVPPAPACVEAIQNGDFEAAATGWTQSSALGFPLICNDGSCGGGLSPYSGSGLAWLGGSNNERALLSQTITIPTKQNAILTYWARTESEDVCRYDYAAVNVRIGNSTRTVQRFYLCSAANSNGWLQHSIDLSKYAGKQVRLEFQVVTDVWNMSSLFVDDVSMLVGDSCGESAGAAAGPQVVPLQPLDEEVADDASMVTPDGVAERPYALPVGPINWRR
jgi:hypothetical protein